MKMSEDFIGVAGGAIILDDKQRILLIRRGPKSRNEIGKWAIPGGAVDRFETRHDAVMRETKEELGIDVRAVRDIVTLDHILPAEDQHWITSLILCQLIQGEPRIMEPEKIDEWGWFALDEAKKLPLTKYMPAGLQALREHLQSVS